MPEPKYSIFINRFKCLDDTSGVGDDEISFVSSPYILTSGMIQK